jgi:hypothetical protein
MLKGAVLDDPRLVDEPPPKPSVEGCFTASRGQSPGRRLCLRGSPIAAPQRAGL